MMMVPTLFLALSVLTQTPNAMTSEEVVAVIWGGGADKSVAQTWANRWEEERVLVEGAIRLAEGFPRSLRSDSLEGLNPGFDIVVLGFCRKSQATDLRAVLKAAYPFIYERTVRAAASGCPSWDQHPYRLVEASRRKSNGGSLGLVHAANQAERESFVESPARFFLAIARGPHEQLLGHHRIVDLWMEADIPPYGCESSVRWKGQDLVLERTCTTHPGAACNRNPGKTQRVTVHWAGTRWEVEEKTLKEWTVNYSRDCAE